MLSVLYLGESSGARILAYGSGITRIGTDYQAALETWEDTPMGPVGDCLFRSVDIVVKPENGFSLGVIAVIDGDDQPEQFFSGSGSDKAEVQAFIAARGTGIGVKVRTVTRSGDVEFQSVGHSFVPIRATP